MVLINSSEYTEVLVWTNCVCFIQSYWHTKCPELAQFSQSSNRIRVTSKKYLKTPNLTESFSITAPLKAFLYRYKIVGTQGGFYRIPKELHFYVFSM